MYTVHPAVDKLCKVKLGVPDTRVREVSEVLIGFLTFLHSKSMVYKEYVGEKASWEDDLRFLLSIFNTICLFCGGASSDHAELDARVPETCWLHTCTGSSCCRDLEDTKRKMRTAILRVLLRSMPRIPALSRWTQTAPCTDFFVMNLVCQRVALPAAMQRLLVFHDAHVLISDRCSNNTFIPSIQVLPVLVEMSKEDIRKQVSAHSSLELRSL